MIYHIVRAILETALNETNIHQFGNINFWTNGALASQSKGMTILQNGYIGVGTSTPSSHFHKVGDSRVESGYLVIGGTTPLFRLDTPPNANGQVGACRIDNCYIGIQNNNNLNYTCFSHNTWNK